MTYLVYRMGFERCSDISGREWKRQREVIVERGLSFHAAVEACRKDRALHMLRERESKPEVVVEQGEMA